MTESSLSIVIANTPEGTKHYVTLGPPQKTFSAGLIPEAIVGLLQRPEEPISPSNFNANSVFRRFLAEVIARHAPDNPDLKAAAARQGQGYIVVIDRRTATPGGSVPPEDIMGVFEVKDGSVVPGSYRASPNHRLLTADGFFQLDRFLDERLHQELAKRSIHPANDSDARRVTLPEP